eukprot:6751375-Heterocapsa_arctica.AAC.1
MLRVVVSKTLKSCVQRFAGTRAHNQEFRVRCPLLFGGRSHRRRFPSRSVAEHQIQSLPDVCATSSTGVLRQFLAQNWRTSRA